MSWCRKCGYGSAVCRISSFSGCPQCGEHALTEDNPFGQRTRKSGERGPSHSSKSHKASGSNYTPEERARFEAQDAREEVHRQKLLAAERAELEAKTRKEQKEASSLILTDSQVANWRKILKMNGVLGADIVSADEICQLAGAAQRRIDLEERERVRIKQLKQKETLA